MRSFAEKTCEICKRNFVPTSGAQKRCPECRDKIAQKPARPPTAAEVRARNARQKETIKALRDEIFRLKGRILAPQQLLVSQIETLEKAIERQRELVKEEQLKAAAIGQRNHELRKGIEEAIALLDRLLKETA